MRVYTLNYLKQLKKEIIMKKMLNWLLVATLIGSATAFTACSKNDDDDKNKKTEETQKTDANSNRTAFQQHIKGNLKNIVQNLNFSSWEVANTLNRSFNVNVLSNPAFNATLHNILQQQVQAGIQPAGEAMAAKGFVYQSTVDLSQLHYRFTLKDDKSGFDMTPAECFELQHTADGITSKLVIDFSGDSKKMVSTRLSKPEQGLGVILLVPAKMTYSIKTNALTGAETEVFKGELNNTITTAGELMDITKDEWNISGSLASSIPATSKTKADQLQVKFNFAKDPATKEFINQFTFVHNGLKLIDIDALNSHQGNLIAMLKELRTAIGADQSLDDLFDASLLQMLISSIMGNSVDKLKVTLADDLVADIKISDVGKAAAVLSLEKAAHRNYAGQADIEAFTQQLNQLISASLECKGVNQQIPMTLKTTLFGVDYVSMPSLKFADEADYVPLTDLLDREGMTYVVNFVDHAFAPASQSLITIRQLLTVLRTFLATEAE